MAEIISIPVQLTGGVPVVTAPAEIDLANAAGLREALLQAAVRGNGTLVVDMSGTQFCGASGLHVLTRAHKQAQAEGGEVVLVVCTAVVLRVCALTGVDRLIPNFPTLDEALAHARAVSSLLPAPGCPHTGNRSRPHHDQFSAAQSGVFDPQAAP